MEVMKYGGLVGMEERQHNISWSTVKFLENFLSMNNQWYRQVTVIDKKIGNMP
jgi:hypothetical protein